MVGGDEFVANGIGDIAQLFMGRVLEGAIGVTVSGAIIYYLTRPKVRAAFPLRSG